MTPLETLIEKLTKKKFELANDSRKMNLSENDIHIVKGSVFVIERIIETATDLLHTEQSLILQSHSEGFDAGYSRAMDDSINMDMGWDISNYTPKEQYLNNIKEQFKK